MKDVEQASGSPVIDVHGHLVPQALLDDLASGVVRLPHVQIIREDGADRVAFAGGEPTRPISAGLTDRAKRAAWLTDNRITHQVVGGWLDLFGYELPSGEGADWAELLSTSILAEISGDTRLTGLASVPLQDPPAAAAALRRRRAHGFAGVMIASRAGGRELDDEAFNPFWEAADETGSVVFLHPGFGSASDRYRDFGLVNGLARLEDTTVTLARLLYAAVPARFPRVRIVVAHAGAGLPYVLGRLVRNHLMNPGVTADPLESFAQLYFDSVVFDPLALGYLVGRVGPGQVLLGSDYPFPIGDLSPRDVVQNAKLSAADRLAILGANAEELFGMSKEHVG